MIDDCKNKSYCIAFQKGALGIQFAELYTEDIPNAEVYRVNYKGIPMRMAITYDFDADKYKHRIDVCFATGIIWDEKGKQLNITQ